MSTALLTRLKARLELYLAAEEKILESNQAWSSPDGMTYTRGNLELLQREISKLENKIAAIDTSGEYGTYKAQQFVFGGR